MTEIEAPFEMANLFPKHTGLPFVVWISVRGFVIAGEKDAETFDQLSKWIELNRATLIAYWKGEIDTQDALETLSRLENGDANHP